MHFPGLSRSDSGSWYSITVQTRLGLRFVPFTRLSSSGDQVPGERTLPRRAVRLITSPVPAAAGAPPQVCRVPPLGSSFLTAALLVDVNRQLGACSQFGGGCHLGGQVCPLPSSSGCHPPVMAGLLSAFSLKAKYFVVYTTSSLSICPLAESEIVSISWLL